MRWVTLPQTHRSTCFFLILFCYTSSFFGLFEITLLVPGVRHLIKPVWQAGGVIGIFFMAATPVVVSFSCTAPVSLWSLLPRHAGDSYVSAGRFHWFRYGIAFPFMFFCLLPSMLNLCQKSGGWMTKMKVSVAFNWISPRRLSSFQMPIANVKRMGTHYPRGCLLRFVGCGICHDDFFTHGGFSAPRTTTITDIFR